MQSSAAASSRHSSSFDQMHRPMSGHKFWNPSKTVSQTIRNSKHWAPNVQSYATAVVRKPLGLFAPL